MDSEAWLSGTEASRPGKECVLSTYCALSAVPGSHVNVLPSSCQWPHQPAAWWENRQCGLVATDPNPVLTFQGCHPLALWPCQSELSTLVTQFPHL